MQFTVFSFQLRTTKPLKTEPLKTVNCKLNTESLVHVVRGWEHLGGVVGWMSGRNGLVETI
jgi:hypothetical protein